MMGSEMRPIEITLAATTPVVAASSAPTKTTAYASPPRSGPNSWPIVSSRSSAMPERSRISPMNVKNGTASSVSFDITPHTRSGSAWNSVVCSRPRLRPTIPNSMPTAASENATGKPSISTMMRPMNISGAMFATSQALMLRCSARRAMRTCRATGPRGSCRRSGVEVALPRDLLGELFLGGLRLEPLQRVRDVPAQERDSLDQLGDALQDEEREAHRHEQARRPDDEAARVGRDLVPHVRIEQQRPRQPSDHD